MRARTACTAILALTLLTTQVAPAATRGPGKNPGWCGTRDTGIAEAAAKHRFQQSRLARSPAQRGSLRAPGVRKAGDVAVIEDDGLIVSEPNTFDLEKRGLKFKRKKDGIKALKGGSKIKADMGDALSLGDDDNREIELPFKVKYFGNEYKSVFVNSDGNLTFVEGESASTERSLSRFLSGPPRVAPLFVDLDPSSDTGGGGVYAKVKSKSVMVTWLDVPEFDKSNQNTFQVEVFSNGKITIAVGNVDAQEAIVGVSPGGIADINLLDLSSDLPFGPDSEAIGELFSQQEQVDDVQIAKTFFESFTDDYDHLVVFLDFQHHLAGDPNIIAYELTAKNEVEGIGLGIFDVSDLWGSDGRLESFVQMGFVNKYPSNPAQGRFFDNSFSTLDILAHEAAHRWLVKVQIKGSDPDALLGRQKAHWSLYFDSDGSFLEGSDLQENSNSEVFTTGSIGERYNDFDLYLMGLLRADNVGDSFYVANASGPGAASAPQSGLTVFGDKVTVSIDDIIAREGPREPSSDDYRRDFKMAVVILGAGGNPVSQASIDQVDKIRKQYEKFWESQVRGEATLDTRLRSK